MSSLTLAFSPWVAGRNTILSSQRPSLRAAAGPRPARRSVQALALTKGAKSSNGHSPALEATPEQLQTTKMMNLVLAYFEEVMSKANADACHRILDSRVVHKDMVRNEGRYGIMEYQQYVQELKQAYPSIWVRPTQFGIVDSHTLFVAFEGRAAEDTPLFKGVDLFHFNDHATKIKEVQVYRSNWLGAEGHEERKKKKQHQKEAGAQP
ncbi:hypothetical protein D9Q98_005223 [Chlorella vulgaris]|uniref:SnoaL-like domain-containing protein n=1 Tax=Chlorella vulgaris TaxID=3077 RepID=A0A9D4YWS3_CHLVU|nr:hypothetical protein D9Q98_005223 [Chlorella vulgaris]